jgi:hypothetical protein
MTSNLSLMILTNEPRLSVFAVTSPSRSLRIPTNLRIASDISRGAGLLQIRKEDRNLRHSVNFKIDTETHVSLLSLEPYTVNNIHYERSAMLSPSARKVSDPTPETLRGLVKLSEGVRTPIQLVSSQIQALSARIELQEEEQKRQLQLEQELILKFSAIQDGGYRPVVDRFQRCTERRDELKVRIENVQKTLLLATSPELSSEERKWFSELGLIRKCLYGHAEWDSNALRNRTQRVSECIYHFSSQINWHISWTIR